MVMMEGAHLVRMMVRARVGGAGNQKRQGDGGGEDGLHVVLPMESPFSPGPESYSAVSLTLT